MACGRPGFQGVRPRVLVSQVWVGHTWTHWCPGAARDADRLRSVRSHAAVNLGRKLFPLFALALDLPEDFFADKVRAWVTRSGFAD